MRQCWAKMFPRPMHSLAFDLRLQASTPSPIQLWSAFLLTAQPLYQVPPGTQQLSRSDFLNVSHFEHIILTIAETTPGVKSNTVNELLSFVIAQVIVDLIDPSTRLLISIQSSLQIHGSYYLPLNSVLSLPLNGPKQSRKIVEWTILHPRTCCSFDTSNEPRDINVKGCPGWAIPHPWICDSF